MYIITIQKYVLPCSHLMLFLSQNQNSIFSFFLQRIRGVAQSTEEQCFLPNHWVQKTDGLFAGAEVEEE